MEGWCPEEGPGGGETPLSQILDASSYSVLWASKETHKGFLWKG